MTDALARQAYEAYAASMSYPLPSWPVLPSYIRVGWKAAILVVLNSQTPPVSR